MQNTATIPIQNIRPDEIEAESFRIIERELGQHDFKPDSFAIVRRVIHATGDFSFANSLMLHPQAISSGIDAIMRGKDILVDVNMAAAGINKKHLEKWGGRVICGVSDPETAMLAAQKGMTRSEAAIERLLAENIGIVAIGNAPTALLKLMELMEGFSVNQTAGSIPSLVIGVPVGFVNAAESKDILVTRAYPFITCLGRKGGTPVAVAIINALLKLAETAETSC